MDVGFARSRLHGVWVVHLGVRFLAYDIQQAAAPGLPRVG
jgi:hypothetical protein